MIGQSIEAYQMNLKLEIWYWTLEISRTKF